LQEYGKEQFLAVRRGYDVPPPPLDADDKRVAWQEKKYAKFSHNLLPLHESLKDTKVRVMDYFESVLAKELQKEKTVLVSAHGNSLRSLVMHLENLSEKDVVNLEIPTGEIRVYTFDATFTIQKREILTQ